MDLSRQRQLELEAEAEMELEMGGATPQSQGPKFDFGPTPKVSDLGGMMNQAGQGMLAGFGDEIGAGLDTGYNFLTGQGGSASLGEQYDAALQARRGAESDFKKQSPWLAGGAELAGAIASPINLMMPGGGGVVGAAKTGARLGALSGIGTSEGGAENRLKGAATGGALGGVVGGGIGAVGEGLKWVGNKLPGVASSLREGAIGVKSTDFLKSSKKGLLTEIDGEPATYLKATMKELAEEGAFSGPKDIGNFIKTNQDVTNRIDNELAGILQAVDANGHPPIMPKWSETTKFIKSQPGLIRDKLAKDMGKAISATTKQLDGSLSSLQLEKQKLYQAFWTDNDQARKELGTYLAKDIKNAIEKAVDEHAIDDSMKGAVKELNRKWGQYITVGKILNRSLADDEAANVTKKVISAVKTTGGGGGGMIVGGMLGGPLGAAAGAGLGLMGTTRTGKFAMAKGAEALSPFLASAGSNLGKIGPTAAMLSGKLGSQQGAPSMDNPEVKQPVAQLEQPSPITPQGEIDPALIQAIIQTESAGNPKAVSPAGAKGLMQLMPAMAKAFGVDDPFDPEQNVRGGTELLKEELKRFGGDVRLALAAYNAGSPAVMKAINRAESADFEVIKQYLPKETQNYVPKVMKIYGV